jgi:hypothetical protein
MQLPTLLTRIVVQQESNFTGIPLDQVINERCQYDIKIKSDGVDTTKLFTGSLPTVIKRLP